MRFGALCLALTFVACREPDATLRSPDGRFSILLRAHRPQPKTYQTPGWAELYGPFGLSCGRADFWDTLEAPASPSVSWHEDRVTLSGAKGFWTLEPCRYVPPPPPPQTPY